MLCSIIENPIKESEGLAPHEAAMVLVLFENQITEDDTESAYKLYKDMEAIRFNKIASNIAFRQLRFKGIIELKQEFSEHDGEPFTAFRLTSKGEYWVLNNQDKIEFKKKGGNSTGKLIDDMPF